MQLLDDPCLAVLRLLRSLRLILVDVHVVAGRIQVNHAGGAAGQGPDALHYALVVGGAGAGAGGHEANAAAPEHLGGEARLGKAQANPRGR